MKTRLSVPLNITFLLIMVGGIIGNLIIGDELSAQPSPAAQAIGNRIKNGGVPGAASAPAPERKKRHKKDIEAEKAQQQNETAAAPPAGAVTPAPLPGEAPAAEAGGAEGEGLAPVKKEHGPVQVISEPFMVYDHKAKADPDKTNRDTDKKDTGKKSEKEDAVPVTAVVADLDGVAAFSAAKDATIQMWYTYDFYLDEYYDYLDYLDYDFEYNEMGGPVAPQTGKDRTEDGLQGTAQKTGQNQRGRKAGSGNAMNQNAGLQGTSTAEERRNANAAQQKNDERASMTARSRNAKGEPLGAGMENGNYSYQSNPYSFYAMKRGNLNAPLSSSSDTANSSKEDKSGKKTETKNNFKKQKEVKIPTTLGKRVLLLELLDMMGERRGKGICDMLYSRYDDLIYTSDYDGTVRRWSPYTKKTQTFTYKREAAVNNTMWGVAFFPAYDIGFPCDVVAGANNNGNIYFWNSYTRKLIADLKVATSDDPKKQAILDIDFAPSGMEVVTAGIDGTAKIIDIMDLQAVSLLKGHKGAVLSAVFDSTGQYVLTAGKDKNVCIWDAYSGEVIASFVGHTGPVMKAVFLNDRFILTCSRDKTARIWELPDEVTLSPASPNSVQYDEEGNPIPQEKLPEGTKPAEPLKGGWANEAMTKDEEIENIADSLEEDDTDATSKENEKVEVKTVDTKKLEDEIPAQDIDKAPRGFEVFRFEGPSPVLSTAYNNYYLFTGCEDGKVRVWDFAPCLETVGTLTGKDDGTAEGNKREKNQQNGVDDPNNPNANLPAGVPPALPPLPGGQPNPGAPMPVPPAATPPGAGAQGTN